MADTSNPAYKHGHAARGAFSPEYHSWASMIQRCTNPNRKSFNYYGGRGIAVCDRWRSFDNFLADMGERPTGTTLEREDTNGNYEPANCCWATVRDQNRNSRQVVWVEIDGRRQRLTDWCDELSISINTVRDRVKHYGLSYAEALMTSVQSRPGQPLKFWRPKRKR